MGVDLKGKEQVFNPLWMPGADDYLRQTRGCGSKATENQRKKDKWELEGLVSETRSLVSRSSAQRKRDGSENTDHVPGLLSASVPSESSLKGGVGKVENHNPALKQYMIWENCYVPKPNKRLSMDICWLPNRIITVIT